MEAMGLQTVGNLTILEVILIRFWWLFGARSAPAWSLHSRTFHFWQTPTKPISVVLWISVGLWNLCADSEGKEIPILWKSRHLFTQAEDCVSVPLKTNFNKEIVEVVWQCTGDFRATQYAMDLKISNINVIIRLSSVSFLSLSLCRQLMRQNSFRWHEIKCFQTKRRQ